MFRWPSSDEENTVEAIYEVQRHFQVVDRVPSESPLQVGASLRQRRHDGTWCDYHQLD